MHAYIYTCKDTSIYTKIHAYMQRYIYMHTCILAKIHDTCKHTSKDVNIYTYIHIHIPRGHPFMTSTLRGRGQAQVDACGRGGGGPAPCGRPHRKLKLRSTDVILSSSQAKKLASFYQNFAFGQKKVEIFLRYKLVI